MSSNEKLGTDVLEQNQQILEPDSTHDETVTEIPTEADAADVQEQGHALGDVDEEDRPAPDIP